MSMNIIQAWVQELPNKSKQKIIEALEEIEEAYHVASSEQSIEWSPKNNFQDSLIVKLRELQVLEIVNQIGGVCWLKINYPLLKQTIKFLNSKQNLVLVDDTIYWPNQFQWNEKEHSLHLGNNDSLHFAGDRLRIFRELALNKGEWVRKENLIKVLADGREIKKDIWSIVPQMNRRIAKDGYGKKIQIESMTKDGISYFRLKPMLS